MRIDDHLQATIIGVVCMLAQVFIDLLHKRYQTNTRMGRVAMTAYTVTVCSVLGHLCLHRSFIVGTALVATAAVELFTMLYVELGIDRMMLRFFGREP